MPGDYDVLAPVYGRIGMADFAAELTPRLLDLAQRNGWLGRRILDLGCGNGLSILWLATHGYPAYGVDRSAAMLQQARQVLQEQMLESHLVEADIRSLPPLDRMELVLALDVVPELDGLRDLEAAFDSAAGVMMSGSFLIFDVFTLVGMIGQASSGDTVLYDDDGLLVFSRNTYDYERQICTRDYDLFQQNTGDGHWSRQQARRVLRAYPLQGIASLLRRHGFDVVTAVDAQLQPLNISRPQADRAIFACRKQ